MSKTDRPFMVQRTCTCRSEKQEIRGSFPLESFRDQTAYVLLGDPGAGKTESFKKEAEESGGKYVKARDFSIFALGTKNKSVTLFIDGLDEMPAVDGDRRHPLDRIREDLLRLGHPRFRLSCREADWLGSSGREALMQVSPDGEVIALHLDPLSIQDIAIILQHKHAVSDPQEFMRKAQEHRLNELLRNPQTLNLLVEAVGGNVWPQSRKEIYEMACRRLVRETNPEHRQAKREEVLPTEKLLEAAGYLSAIQLLSGIAGFALDQEKADKQYFCWRELTDYGNFLLAALKTNLFQADGEQRRVPVHRSVAEFLGARYIAARVEHHGLPLGRLLALMTGEDGGVVADLRGLVAWLSVHYLSGRHLLIGRDPLGLVLYGDVRNFTPEEKNFVFAALKNEAQRYPWFRSGDWSSLPFGALGTLDMVPTFRQILSGSSRDEADQALVDCVIDAIRHGERLTELADLLNEIARDASYQPRIRVAATLALIHVLPDNHSGLLKLAGDIRQGIVEDRDDEILGGFLKELYLKTILPAQVFDYLHTPKQSSLIGTYFMFWIHYLPEVSPVEELPQLLDKLVQKKPSMGGIWEDNQLNRMAGNLLTHALNHCGDRIDNRRLHDWLGAGLDEYGHPRLDGKYVQQISAWFAVRPERFKSVIELGISLCSNPEDIWMCMSRCEMRLYGSPPPQDIEMWYLEKVKAAAEKQQRELARYFFTKVIHLKIQQGGQRELTLPALEFLESWTGAYPILKPCLDDYTYDELDGWRQKHALMDRAKKTEHQDNKKNLVKFYRQHIAAIREGSAYPQIFYDLARAHQGLIFETSGENPHERLKNFLDGDQELIEAAYTGLRETLNRHDLPTVSEVVDLHIKGKMHFILLACAVGMEELYKSDDLNAMRLSDRVLSILIAFRFTYSVGNDPSWFDALLLKHPKLVAEVLISYALPTLRSGKEYVSGLYQLACNDAYCETARNALPELLEGFPLRVRKSQLSNALDPLLKGALRYLDRKLLASLIARKLTLKSMDAAQRVYWLGCALLIAPSTYEAKMIKYLGKSKVRRAYLAKFLHNSYAERILPERALLPESTLVHLIELLAPDCSPEHPTGAHWVSPAMNTAEMLRSFINNMGSSPNRVASDELEHLLALPNLKLWYNHLRGALHTQRIARRKASFHRVSVENVDRTLSNLQPANAADLAAVAFDHLRDIARNIRDGSTNDYRQFWSYNEQNIKLAKPKPENDCRDALLSDLQIRLGCIGIDAQREGNYADNKRADIRVSFSGTKRFNVPIEIKKDNNPDLWIAIHKQLIAKYVRDPDTDGHGIYLVFWFGGENLPPPLDGSRKPRNAQELEDRIRLTLSPEERHRILVCVIDCALP